MTVTPLTTLKLAELAGDLFPPGVLNVINGHGRSVGAAMCQHPKVAMVSLTGDVGTGKEVARAASASLKRVHLETRYSILDTRCLGLRRWRAAFRWVRMCVWCATCRLELENGDLCTKKRAAQGG